MARPLRIEYAGALYHVTARGNARQSIFLSNEDREGFLELLSSTVRRYHWRVHAYCLMGNHYHLVIETVDNNLSAGMKYLNGGYSQRFNRTHRRVGHVFQGRFKSILVERNSYLLELCRYVVLNPVRAEMVRTATDWPWSNFRATAGLMPAPEWLHIEWTLSMFASMRTEACHAYCTFVAQGKGQPSPWAELKNQIYLGSDGFIEDAQCQLSLEQSLDDIPRLQKSAPPKPLAYYSRRYARKEAMARAYLAGHYSLNRVGDHFGVSSATVSRAAKRFENGERCKV